MAESIAASNPSAARELLQEAFGSFRQVMGRGFGGGGVWGPNSAALMAAALLPVVERVDPDRLGEWVARIAALRWFPRTLTDITTTVPDTSGIESMRSSAALAAMLVRYDRTLAQSIARPIIEHFRSPLSDLENRYLDRYAVFPTLTLADPEAMAEAGGGLARAQGSRPWPVPRHCPAHHRRHARRPGRRSSGPSSRRSVSDLEIVERED